MRIIKPSFEILEQTNIFKCIELAGRTCYKSEDKITDQSAEKFVQMIIDRKHTAMLEHGTVYLKIPKDLCTGDYINNKYSNVYENLEEACLYYVTTNYRVIVENGWQDDLQYQCEPTEHHEKRVTVKFVCDRGVSHELVRHRVFSFAQESTRYCNYGKEKFGNELTFIMPFWLMFDGITGEKYHAKHIWLQTVGKIEEVYLDLIECGWTPQEARSILPNSLKTEVVVTGFVKDWVHFFGLRCDKAAHPQMRELAVPLQEEFIKRGLINK